VQRTKLNVVIDPGHGGDTRVGGSAANNAVGPNGLLEKDLTLDIARRVAAALDDRFTVTLTRTADANSSLVDRAAVSKVVGADVFVSIHLNGWRDPGLDGSEAWVATGSDRGSHALARSVLDRVLAVTRAPDRGVREADLGVLLPARQGPHTVAALLELAFLTNPQEADRLGHDEYRQALAQAIAEGIAARSHAAVAQALERSPARVDGIDCTSGNRLPSWDELREDGIQFVLLKASEGLAWIDDGLHVPNGEQPRPERGYGARHEDARANHFPVGAFHYPWGTGALADGPDLLRRQADSFIRFVGRLLPGDLPPTLDFEENHLIQKICDAQGHCTDGATDGVPWRDAQWLAPLEAFLDRVETAFGRVPMIYTSRRIWRTHLHDDAAFARFGDYPLWTADYMAHPPVIPNAQHYGNRLQRDPLVPAPWGDNWTIWQYSGDFTPRGDDETPHLHRADLKIDMNVLNGGIHVLRGLVDLGRPAPHGDAVRFVAYTEDDGTIKVLTYLGYWLDANLTEMAKEPDAAQGPLAAGDVVACEVGGHQFYAFRGRSDAHLYELERNGSEFTLRDLTRDVVNAGLDHDPVYSHPAADPSYLVEGIERRLVYRGENDHQYLLRTNGGTWQTPVLDVTGNTAADPASGNAALYAAGGDVHVAGRAGGDGHLMDEVAASKSDLTQDSAAPPATYQPAVYAAADGTTRIVYRALRGEVHQIDPAQSHDEPLSRLAAGGAPTCAGNPAVFVLGGVPHVVYRRPDGRVHEIAGDGAGGWTQGPLPCDDRAAADPAAYTATDAGQPAGIVVFRNRDGNFVEAKLTAAGWTCAPIQPAENPPPAEQLGWAASVPVAGALATSDQDDPISTADSTLVDHVVPAAHCGAIRAGGFYRERVPTGIVIHVLDAGGYAAEIANWHSGSSCVPPHYVIKDDGEITQMVAEKFMAQHAGPNANPTMIGIEHDGWDYDPDFFTEDMYVKSAGLVRDICARNAIDVDRAHIIGHDEVPHFAGLEDHGDPGGYWDWDYYLALIRWDGADQTMKPLRQTIDTSGLSLPSASASWQSGDRDSGIPTATASRRKVAPTFSSAYGRSYLWANGDPGADPSDAVDFTTYVVPKDGVWMVSIWWPILADANTKAQIEIRTTSSNPDLQLMTQTVDQRARSAMRLRSTVALPNPGTPTWFPLSGFDLKQGESITVRVLRKSDATGKVIADAVRFLMIPSQP
jgi:N-acetylmuramoyl-L-alanine amidase